MSLSVVIRSGSRAGFFCFILASCTYGQGSRLPDCEPREIPLAFPDRGSVATVDHHVFASKLYSTASMRLTNHADNFISALLIQVDYENQRGERMFNISYELAATHGRPLASESSSPPAQDLRGSIAPGASAWIGNSSPVVASQCPRAARIVLVKLSFSDGSSYEHQSPGWVSDSLLDSAPPFESPTRIDPSSYFLLKIAVSAQGHVREVLPLATTSEGIPATLEKALRSWSFLPATRNGKPEDSELTLLLRFHPSDKGQDLGALPMPAEQLPQTFIVVDLVPYRTRDRKRVEGRWTILYGGFPM